MSYDRERWRARDPAVQQAANELRRRQTSAERALWQALRRDQLDGLHFRRQHAHDRFVLDFYCAAYKLCVELDGEVHDAQADYDEHRTAALALEGIRVIRFRNDEVFHDLPRVLDRIRLEIYGAEPEPED